MSGGQVRRRLAAILAADVAGYSRLMGVDERATIATLRTYREVFRTIIDSNSGRVVDMAGDSVLAVFDSAAGAVQAATETQARLATQNEALPDDRRMLFRIGVNLGDIEEADDGTIYGDGVNLAARLESLAAPGGVTVSESAYQQVRRNPGLGFVDAGVHTVKNIEDPVHAYQIVEAEQNAVPRRKNRPSRGLVFGGVAAAAVLIAIGALWLTERTSEPSAVVKTPSVPKFSGPSIAVLAFDNMSLDESKIYIADGLAKNIIASLTQFKELSVIARNSSFKYRRRSVDVREVGRDLGVAYVLEGSVQQAADQIRVTLQLLDAGDGSHVWAETYDRDLTNIFALQDEITADVVGNIADLRGAIAQDQVRDLASRPDPGTYDLLLRAREYYRTGGAEAHGLARDQLERAVKIDPALAGAYPDLALIYVHEVLMGYNPKPDPFKRAYDAIQTALSLDPNDSNAHLMFAWYYYALGDIENFRKERDVTLDLNPNRPMNLAVLGMMAMFSGDREYAAKLLY